MHCHPESVGFLRGDPGHPAQRRFQRGQVDPGATAAGAAAGALAVPGRGRPGPGGTTLDGGHARGADHRFGGAITVGPTYQRLELAWAAGVAAMARAGVGVVVDEVLLDGAVGQARWNAALAGVGVLWVGVRCDAAEAARREGVRGDWMPGMAALQADSTHEGVAYDLVMDTTASVPETCAQRIVAAMDQRDAS